MPSSSLCCTFLPSLSLLFKYIVFHVLLETSICSPSDECNFASLPSISAYRPISSFSRCFLPYLISSIPAFPSLHSLSLLTPLPLLLPRTTTSHPHTFQQLVLISVSVPSTLMARLSSFKFGILQVKNVSAQLHRLIIVELMVSS